MESQISNVRTYPSYHSLSQLASEECDLFGSYVSSIGTLVRQYCYKCEEDILRDAYNPKDCINPNCNDEKFEVIEHGVMAYYMCRENCRGLPLACDAPTAIDNVDWTCSEDIEQPLTPRKFLACQTCHSVCSHGYQEKRKVTISCKKINSTHIGWNSTEIKPKCINIIKICGTPNISGVTLEDCEIYSDLDSLTDQYSFHQECTARCGSGLYQVQNVSTSCGENGSWSHLDRLEKMCIDPSQEATNTRKRRYVLYLLIGGIAVVVVIVLVLLELLWRHLKQKHLCQVVCAVLSRYLGIITCGSNSSGLHSPVPMELPSSGQHPPVPVELPPGGQHPPVPVELPPGGQHPPVPVELPPGGQHPPAPMEVLPGGQHPPVPVEVLPGGQHPPVPVELPPGGQHPPAPMEVLPGGQHPPAPMEVLPGGQHPPVPVEVLPGGQHPPVPVELPPGGQHPPVPVELPPGGQHPPAPMELPPGGQYPQASVMLSEEFDDTLDQDLLQSEELRSLEEAADRLNGSEYSDQGSLDSMRRLGDGLSQPLLPEDNISQE
ncbi:uncharacterized protein LOC117328846 isoform X2 [Pecten maximus]|uniref:uncharacterized protein LOC117328846 isoform X2 n=1 Tax=Pecten maximus TaxID=6579 RepID=UPI0014590027|nr:uncharacterized protein LOC117328846 isoform X2 [Pecten maximus]